MDNEFFPDGEQKIFSYQKLLTSSWVWYLHCGWILTTSCSYHAFIGKRRGKLQKTSSPKLWETSWLMKNKQPLISIKSDFLASIPICIGRKLLISCLHWLDVDYILLISFHRASIETSSFGTCRPGWNSVFASLGLKLRCLYLSPLIEMRATDESPSLDQFT